jgi:hypothetical protein
MSETYLPQRPRGEMQPVANILDLLDRILDKGVVIMGDIRVSIAEVELLRIQIRLLIASVDKAKELGIDFSWAGALEPPKGREKKKIVDTSDVKKILE